MKVLVTGGAGYIGSHTLVCLVENDYTPVVLDNFVNSNPIALQRVENIVRKPIVLVKGDVTNLETVKSVFRMHQIEAVIHFSGLKAVGESVQIPLEYYQNNIKSTLVLLSAMQEFGVQKMVFSSSATVYNDDDKIIEYDEATTRVGRANSPYGTSKVMQEYILQDAVNGNEFTQGLQVIALRYFNPVGAHPSGKIGEDPQGVPNNLTPFITQVLVGRRKFLNVWGNDYSTPDGTCLRDYIHVQDLAQGHVLALKYLNKQTGSLFDAINLGTGRGYSVFEVIKAFETATGQEVPYQIASRRLGDLPVYFAKTNKARKVLGFETMCTLQDMANDAWNWQKNNPNGYASNMI